MEVITLEVGSQGFQNLGAYTWNLLKAVCRVAIFHKNLATRNIII